MSLVNTLMQSLRTAYTPTLDKNELRPSVYGALDFFQKDTKAPGGILAPEAIDKIKRSMGNTVVIPVLDAPSVTIGNTRSCTIQDSENTSQLVTLTFTTYAFGFTMTPAQHFNNDVAYQQDFDRKLKAYLLKFASTLDTACVAKLEADKNQNAGTLATYYPLSGNALQVTLAQTNDFYNNLEAIMNEMDFYGNIKVISSNSGKPNVMRLKNQGASNATNEQFQLGGYEWYWTNRVANAGGKKSTLYAVQEGSVAMQNRNDPDAIMGSRIGDSAVWDVVNVPIVNMDMAAFYTKDCADRSALHSGTSNLRRTMLEGFEWSTDVITISAYNSNIAGTYNPILKAELSAT